ncbi:hypothetical protein D9M71_377390 [compost metagenome]
MASTPSVSVRPGRRRWIPMTSCAPASPGRASWRNRCRLSTNSGSCRTACSTGVTAPTTTRHWRSWPQKSCSKASIWRRHRCCAWCWCAARNSATTCCTPATTFSWTAGVPRSCSPRCCSATPANNRCRLLAATATISAGCRLRTVKSPRPSGPGNWLRWNRRPAWPTPLSARRWQRSRARSSPTTACWST